MLLINFSKKASVVFSRIKPRTYLMLLLLSISNLGYSNMYQKVLVFNSVKPRNIYDEWYSALIWLISFVIGLLSFKVLSELRRHPSSNASKTLIAALHTEKINSQRLKEKTKLLGYSNSTLGIRSSSLTDQLNRISEDLNSNHHTVKERLIALSNQSSAISITTQFINKYLT